MNSLIQQLDETLAINNAMIEQSKQLINRLKKRIEISNEILRRNQVNLIDPELTEEKAHELFCEAYDYVTNKN